jgi:hypothetical protein
MIKYEKNLQKIKDENLGMKQEFKNKLNEYNMEMEQLKQHFDAERTELLSVIVF